MANKYKFSPVEKYNQEIELKKEQELKRKKYNVEDENVIIVEKNNTVKFLVNVLLAVVKTIATIIIILLAAIGLMCLIYPSTRMEFFQIIFDIFSTILKFF